MARVGRANLTDLETARLGPSRVLYGDLRLDDEGVKENVKLQESCRFRSYENHSCIAKNAEVPRLREYSMIDTLTELLDIHLQEVDYSAPGNIKDSVRTSYMSCSYVCASCCRKLLRRHARLLPTQRSCNAFITSFGQGLRTAQISNSSRWKIASFETERSLSSSHEPPQSAVDGDFLTRLLDGRTLGEGPYSSRKDRNFAFSEQAGRENNLMSSIATTARDWTRRGNKAKKLSPEIAAVQHQQEGEPQESSFESKSLTSHPVVEAKSRVNDHAAVRERNRGIHSQESYDILGKRIGRVVSKGHGVLLETLWKDSQMASASNPKTVEEEQTLKSIYGHFLLGFMRLHRPRRAVEVWNALLQCSITPTLQMWDTMLRGIGAVRDHKGVNQIWDMLLESNVKPDAHLWASRIHALTNSGSWKHGLQAYEEMLRNWVLAARQELREQSNLSDLADLGDVGHHPKPTTEAVNGLISGLARHRKEETILKVLSTAKMLGIQPDTYTFNAMLQPALKDRDWTKVDALLEEMRRQDIQPDIATFTMILRSLFRSDPTDASNPQGVEARHEMANNLIRGMEEHGLQPSPWTFSAIINGLLKLDEKAAPGNLEAAYAVFSHMAEKQISPSSSIYTSFISYHFSQQQVPDLAAIEHIWQLARSDSSLVLDTVFFDRLVEGFARCGQIAKMKTALAHAGKLGRSPGWVALREAAKAMHIAGDTAGVEEMLTTVRMELSSGEAIRPRIGKQWFLETLQEFGYETQGLAAKDKRAEE